MTANGVTPLGNGGCDRPKKKLYGELLLEDVLKMKGSGRSILQLCQQVRRTLMRQKLLALRLMGTSPE